MDSQASRLTLGLLPEPRTRWGRFVLSYGVQSVIMSFFVIVAIAYPEVLVLPVHDYHFVSLVSTPPPVPQAPAPISIFVCPSPKITEPVAPRPEAMRVPQELVQKKTPVPEEQAPKVTLAAKKNSCRTRKPIIPRPPVKTNVFSNGSSATPTMAAAPSKVQTGGFGDPNGVPASDPHGHPVTIAQAGSYRHALRPRLRQRHGRFARSAGCGRQHWFRQRRGHRQQYWPDFRIARCGSSGRFRRCRCRHVVSAES